MRELKETYGKLLKSVIRGAKFRAFCFGYGSERLEGYLKEQGRRIMRLELDASEKGEGIYSRENLQNSAKLFGLEVKAEMSRAGIPI